MAVSPPQALHLAHAVAGVYYEAEQQLLALVAQSAAKGVNTPNWVQTQLNEVQFFRKNAEKLMNQVNTAVPTSVANSINKAALIGQETAAAEVARALKKLGKVDPSPLPHPNKTPTRAIALLALETQNKLQRTTPAILRNVEDDYREVIAKVSGNVLVGALTQKQALQQALDQLAAKGITGFQDKTGRQWEMAAYAEMATRTAVSRALIESHTQELQARGQNLVIVSDNPQECAKCRPYEGKILWIGPGKTPTELGVTNQLEGGTMKVKIKASLAEARADGLYHPNCRHSHSAYMPGITEPPEDTADPEGDKDRQKLRYLERQIRKAKREQAVALDPAAKQAADAKVKHYSAAIKHHTDTTSAKRQRDREVPRAGNAGNVLPTDKLPTPTPVSPAATPPPVAPAPASAPPVVSLPVPGASAKPAQLAKYAQANLSDADFKQFKAIQFGSMDKADKPGALAKLLQDKGKPFDPDWTPTTPAPPTPPAPPAFKLSAQAAKVKNPHDLPGEELEKIAQGAQNTTSKMLTMKQDALKVEHDYYKNKLANQETSTFEGKSNATYQQKVLDEIDDLLDSALPVPAKKVAKAPAKKATAAPAGSHAAQVQAKYAEANAKHNAAKKAYDDIALGNVTATPVQFKKAAKALEAAKKEWLEAADELAKLGSTAPPIAPAVAKKVAKAPAKKTASSSSTGSSVARKYEALAGARSWSSSDAGKRWASRVWDNEAMLPPEQFDAVRSYTGSGYTSMNGALRRGNIPASQRMPDNSAVNRHINNLDRLIEEQPRVPEDIVVCRNTGVEALGLQPHEVAQVANMGGRTFGDPGYLSTSVNSAGAMGQMAIKLFLRVPEGSKGIYVSGKPGGKALSAVGGGEAELVLARGTQFKIAEVRSIGGGRFEVVAEVVAQ